MRQFFFRALGALFFVCAGCSASSETAPEENSSGLSAGQEAFFEALSGLCGNAYQGWLVSDDAVDADFAKAPMVIHVRDCDAQSISIPLHVGEDRSRTWIISKTEQGLRLKHDHRHEDGEADAVTFYGGDTAGRGTAQRQEFPASAYSKDLFLREGLDVSVDNIWAVEVVPGERYAYELRRPNRFFRVEFDLSTSVAVPPPAWGYGE